MENSRYRSTGTSIACIVIAAVAGYFGGQVGSTTVAPPEAAVEVSDEIRTRRLVIVDENGEVRAGLSVGQGSSIKNANFWLGSPGGVGPAFSLWLGELKGVEEAGMVMTSRSTESGSAGRLMLRNASGLPTVSMVYGPNRSIALGPEKADSIDPLRIRAGKTRLEWPRK